MVLTLKIPWASCCLGIPAWCATYTLCTHLYKVSTTSTWHNILSTQFKLNICTVKLGIKEQLNKEQLGNSEPFPIQGVHNITWHNILSTQFKLNICMYHLSTKKLFILRTFQLDIYLLYLDSMKAWFCNIWNRIVFYHCQNFFII